MCAIVWSMIKLNSIIYEVSPAGIIGTEDVVLLMTNNSENWHWAATRFHGSLENRWISLSVPSIKASSMKCTYISGNSSSPMFKLVELDYSSYYLCIKPIQNFEKSSLLPYFSTLSPFPVSIPRRWLPNLNLTSTRRKRKRRQLVTRPHLLTSRWSPTTVRNTLSPYDPHLGLQTDNPIGSFNASDYANMRTGTTRQDSIEVNLGSGSSAHEEATVPEDAELHREMEKKWPRSLRCCFLHW
jgi:hypothetical protein